VPQNLSDAFAEEVNLLTPAGLHDLSVNHTMTYPLCCLSYTGSLLIRSALSGREKWQRVYKCHE